MKTSKKIRRVCVIFLSIVTSACLFILDPIPSIQPIHLATLYCGLSITAYLWLANSSFRSWTMLQNYALASYLAAGVAALCLTFQSLHPYLMLHPEIYIPTGLTIGLCVSIVFSGYLQYDPQHQLRLYQNPLQYWRSWSRRQPTAQLSAVWFWGLLWTILFIFGWGEFTLPKIVSWAFVAMVFITSIYLRSVMTFVGLVSSPFIALASWALADAVLASAILIAFHPWVSLWLKAPLFVYIIMGSLYIIACLGFRLFVPPCQMSHRQRQGAKAKLFPDSGLYESQDPPP